MGIRRRGYWLRQAEAVRRHTIADIARGVGIGMAGSKDGQDAMDELELTTTAEEIKRQQRESEWGLMKLFGNKGGKGV